MGVMVVSVDGETLSGIISERDIAYGLHKRRGELLLTKVSMMMTKNVITCTTQTSVDDAMKLMSTNRIRHLVVMSDAGKIAGLVSIRDVLKPRIDRVQKKADLIKSAAAVH